MQGEVEKVKKPKGLRDGEALFECREPEAELEKATCRRMRGKGDVSWTVEDAGPYNMQTDVA